ncbi:MAG: nitroreductase family deazaflavin-dependent oxidoreductase [Dehalococcoidia bacterium]|nr:nitroreductase family deazaflavin-dependent oxidoreductase [Dehalococcoidia bacterium]
MSVELTPNGSRGAGMDKLPRPLVKAMFRLGFAIYLLLGGRMRIQGAYPLVLTTVGAKSGKMRKTLLGWFPDGDNAWLVVASFDGSAMHPAWYVNMAKNPDSVWMELGKLKLKVQAESLKCAEREEAWGRVVSRSPGYAAYQKKTDREIPVVRLRPAPPSAD